MSNSTQIKTCGICGEDCSNRPRTKDAAGRYFCKPCYERAAASKSPGASREGNVMDIGVEHPEPAWLNAVATSANRRCPKCKSTLAGDAIVCITCGTNLQTGAAMNVSVVAAPREPILNGWLGPLILGGLMVLTSVIGGFTLYGTEAGFAIFAILFLFLVLPWHLWTLINARGIPGAQLKIWAIPLYNFFHVFAISANRYLKAFTVGMITIVITFFVMGYELEKQGYFERRSEDEGENVRVIHGANVPQNVRPGPPPKNDFEPRPDQIPEWDPNRGKATTRPAKPKP